MYVCRYDKKDTTKLQLVDLQMIGAMGPPGGGRNPITPRFLRHFNVIGINEFSDDTMSRIFSNIVTFKLKVFPNYTLCHYFYCLHVKIKHVCTC